MSWQGLRDNIRGRTAGRLFLGALSLVYGAVVIARRGLYDLGLLPRKRLPAKVVCIGNLTTGGTGKTPAALLAASALRRKGAAVAILSRGYGRRRRDGKAIALLDGPSPPWTECGDEPWMMHQALRGLGVPVLVCADRARAGLQAVTDHRCEILVLDDGFQHLKLARDLDIVLVNATDPFGGERLLPLGNLREPIRALSRAGLIVLTHADKAGSEALEALRGRIRSLNPQAPLVETAHRADFLLEAAGGRRLKLGHLEGRKVAALSGIGDPSSFEEELSRIGVEVAQRWRYPDHHPYAARELEAAERLRAGLPLVTTFKDLARFPEGWPTILAGGEVLALGIKLEILKGKTAWSQALSRLAQS